MHFGVTQRCSLALLCSLVFVGGLVGCEKSTDQKLLDARELVASKNKPERAEKLLKSVLEQRPESFDAKVLLADAHRLQGDFNKAEAQLDALSENAGVTPEDQSSLDQNQRANKTLLVDHYTSLYAAWAESLNPDDEPDTFVDVVRRGLAWEPTNIDLNRRLVDFYWNKGQRLEQQGDKTKAAAAYENILSLQIPSDSDRRAKAEARARQLRLEAFKQAARKRWNESAKQQIAGTPGIRILQKSAEKTSETSGKNTAKKTAGQRVADDQTTLLLEAEQEFGSRIDTENQKEVDRARAAVKAKLTVLLRKLVLAVSELPDDADLTVLGDNKAAEMMLNAALSETSSDANASSESAKNNEQAPETEKKQPEGVEISGRSITLRTRLSLDEVFEMAYDIQAAYRKATDDDESTEQTPAGATDTKPPGASSGDKQ